MKLDLIIPFLAFVIFFSSCLSEPDIASGIIGNWKCTKATYELLKPDWAETNIGSRYEQILDDHIKLTEKTSFQFMEGNNIDNYQVMLTGGRSLFSTWSVTNETRAINFSLTQKKVFDENSNDPRKGKVNVRLKMRLPGFHYGLYEDAESMTWNVKELAPKSKLVVTETLASETVRFTYYLEFY